MMQEVIKDIANTVRTAINKGLESIEPRLKALEERPIAQDGKSVTVEDVQPLLQEMVSKAVGAIEAPKGEDGKSVTVEDVEPMLQEMVSKAVGAIEVPKGEDGKSVTVEDVEPMLQEMVSKAVGAIEAPKGEDGKSVTVEDVEPMLQEMVSKAVGAIEVPKGEDGKSVTVEDVQPLLQEMVSKAVGAIEVPKGEDGKSVTVEDVQPLLQEMVSKAVGDLVNKAQEVLSERLDKALQAIPAPRDALDIEILPHIDTEKSYPRGTFATHDGGLWRSYEKTHGMRGWECIVNGVKSHSVEYDGQRKAVIKSVMSDGTEVSQDINIPAVLNKGVWRDGEYEKGDMVQLSGSSWLCVEDTNERPSIDCKSWLLAAKKGGTGDSAYDIARKAGFEGDKQAWLDSLAKKTTVKVN